jgi:hypothetical protein
MFGITRDISTGLPPAECLRIAINETSDRAQLVGNFLVIIASLCIFTLPFAIPLCSDYEHKKQYTDEDHINDLHKEDRKFVDI